MQPANYVQEYNGRYIIAEQDRDGRWYAEIRPELRDLDSSIHTIFGRTLGQVATHAYSYDRYDDALYQAWRLYGGERPS